MKNFFKSYLDKKDDNHSLNGNRKDEESEISNKESGISGEEDEISYKKDINIKNKDNFNYITNYHY